MRVTFRGVLIGGLVVFWAVVAMVVFMPAMMESPPTTTAHPYTDVEAKGRRIYYTNGCYNCHTQYVRANDTAMGPVSERGNYIYDIPMLFGSERTGPDLSYVGRKRSEAWMVGHFRAPRQYSPLSLMPSFEFMSEDELSALAAYLFALGDRVAEERMIMPPAPYQGASDPNPPPEVGPLSPDQPHGWSTWRESGLQAGKEIYVAKCLSCHGCSGNGLGTYAGTMAVTPANFGVEPFRSMPPDQWFWHVSEGVPGTLMPTWKQTLPDSARWAVIRYVTTVFAKPVMRDPDEGEPPSEFASLKDTVKLTYGALEAGKIIYTRECLICHGCAGRGDGIYAANLQPPPPDFGDGSYGTEESPAVHGYGFFWRISEGLPWSSMPSWRIHYGEDDIWRLVEYVTTYFTQTSKGPSGSVPSFNFPSTFQSAKAPSTVSYERGRKSFAKNCALCHGLSGNGNGWSGSYLEPSPAEFTVMKFEQPTEQQYLAKITFGVPGSAMPSWGELLPEAERWDLVYFLFQSFLKGRETPKSSEGSGQVSAEFITLSEEDWTESGHTISTSDGKNLYGIYCAACHGADGAGNGPATTISPSGGPAPFPSNMTHSYILWRIWSGVPETLMYEFEPILSETDIWDLASYVQSLTAGKPASKPKGGG
jgi:mono/diheme cytochrome c family protein